MAIFMVFSSSPSIGWSGPLTQGSQPSLSRRCPFAVHAHVRADSAAFTPKPRGQAADSVSAQTALIPAHRTWGGPPSSDKEHPVNQLVLSVPDISCGHCVKAISHEVGQVPGVSTVDVDVTTKTVTVTGAADPSAVRSAIVEAGYHAA
jgi:copper chaperone CopZ